MRVQSFVSMLIGVVALLCAQIAPATAQDATPAPTPVQVPQEDRPFEFYPADTGLGSYFQATIEAGSSGTLTALVANYAASVQDFRIYPVNAFTAEGGGFGAADYGTILEGPSLWLDLSEEVHTIETMTGLERTFSISVPEGTAPGQYITAVAAQHAESTSVTGTISFDQIVRIVVPILITVPGETTTSFSVGQPYLMEGNEAWLLKIPLTNDGDVLVKPTGTVDVLSESGTVIATFPVEMASIYARDETTLTVLIQFTGYEAVTGAFVSLTDPASGVVAEIRAEDLGTPVASDTTSTQSPVQITSVAVVPGPAADNVQFATLDVTINNSGDAIQNGQLTLVAVLDGVEMERYPMSQSLTMNNGETTISSRYIPATGWTTGTWTFELMLQVVDTSGVAVVLDTARAETGIVIP